MSALILLVIGAAWGLTLYFVTYIATFALSRKWLRHSLSVVVTIALFTLPVRDEIKGAEEFEALCRTGGVYQIAPDAVGKVFDLKSSDTGYKKLNGYARPVEQMTITYTDTKTGSIIASTNAYFARGGWLVQNGLLKNSAGGDGALIGRPQCFPSDLEAARLQAITNKTAK